MQLSMPAPGCASSAYWIPRLAPVVLLGLCRAVAGAKLVDGQPSDASEAGSKDAGSLPFYDLLILVPSNAKWETTQRKTIRETWMQYLNESAVNCTPCKNHTAKVLFAVGQEEHNDKIEEEAEMFGDMGILKDFKEPPVGYTTGSAEKIQRSIRYAVEHFKFRLLMKVSSNSWVFVDRLLEFLDHHKLFQINSTMPGVYGGSFEQSLQLYSPPEVVAGTDSKLSIASLEAQAWSYSVHAQGAGYLLSPDLCEFIAGMGAASEDMSGAPKWGEDYGWAPVPRLLGLPGEEDVSIGFWLQVVNHTKISMPIYASNYACTPGATKSTLVDRCGGPSELRQRWQAYVATGDACGQGFKPADSHTLLYIEPQKQWGYAEPLGAKAPNEPNQPLLEVESHPRMRGRAQR